MSSPFPRRRMRRLRMSEPLRRMVRETRLSPADLVAPVFVCPGQGVRREVASMPKVYQLSVEQAVEECRMLAGLGLAAVLLFGLPAHKDEQASGAWAEEGIVQQALRAIKEALGDRLVLMADTCLCEYMSHGHCGVVEHRGERGVYLDNDASVALVVKTAVSQARAGADVVAPSDMMDGRVGAIRRGLDEAGLSDTPIVSYAVKYASAYYGPFREAAQSSPAFGDRRSHQMDPCNGREAIEEARLDADEGADILMVKPAGPNLDVLAEMRRRFTLPLAAYQVSGEYAMIKAAGQRGWIDEAAVMMESVTAIKRAGADLIVTYFAPDLARALG